MPAFRIDYGQHGGLRLSGELDLSTAPQLCDALLPMVVNGGDVVVDLAAVAFMDGPGFRPLVLAAHWLEGRGHVVLKSPSRPVAKVLRLVKAEEFPNLEIDGSNVLVETGAVACT
jgi:anti-anti-sigma factor